MLNKFQGKSPLSRPERSGGPDNGEISPRTPALDSPQERSQARENKPSSAVPPKPVRRTFSAAYKARIVEEADACNEPGKIGELLRREGLYSSHLVDWRRIYRQGALDALKQRRGPESDTALPAKEKTKYERKIARLQERLRQAELIIDVQKKYQTSSQPNLNRRTTRANEGGHQPTRQRRRHHPSP